MVYSTLDQVQLDRVQLLLVKTSYLPIINLNDNSKIRNQNFQNFVHCLSVQQFKIDLRKLSDPIWGVCFHGESTGEIGFSE